MRKNRNPHSRKGNRNVFCSDYNNCLDVAIERSWNSWNCGQCIPRFEEATNPEATLIADEAAEFSICNLQTMDWDYEFLDGDADIAVW
jgi:hypothetical protein